MRLLQTILSSLLFALPFTTLADPQTNPVQDHACLKEYQLNNFEKAYGICLPAAKQNNPEAQYVIGMLAKRGKGTARSESQAMEWLNKAADNGYGAAQLKLGKMICTSTHPDYDKAFQYFLSAANQDLFEAQFLVALCYQNALGTSKNPDLALQWYNLAVTNGLDAPFLEQKEKIRHQKVTRNHPLRDADNFISMKLAAQEGSPNAQFEVGLYYLHGQDTEQDDAKALNYIKAAAEQDNPQAKSYLAWMNILGIGEPQNMAQAIYWFTRCFDVALVEKPLTVEPPTSQQEAQNQTTAFYNQALKLLEDSDPENQKQGIALLTHAANSNYVNAQLKLAQSYQTGKWVKQNAKTAALWFEKAAHNGSSDAQYALGWIYFNGEGVPKDVSLSYYWFEKAAHFGRPKAKSAKKFVQAYMAPTMKPPKNLLEAYKASIDEKNQAPSKKLFQKYLKPIEAKFQKVKSKDKDKKRLAVR